jgi:Mn2+/Fe2+ NRAMP family transporter
MQRGRRTVTKSILAIVVWVVLAVASPAMAATADEAKIAEISQVLDRLHASAAKADGDAYFALFAADAVFIGTDATERWPLAAFRAYALPLFAQGKGWRYTPRTRHVTLAQIPCGCIAWFDEIVESEHYGVSRGTGVLALTQAGWKIEQYALTFPIPNDLAADMTATIKAYEARHDH